MTIWIGLTQPLHLVRPGVGEGDKQYALVCKRARPVKPSRVRRYRRGDLAHAVLEPGASRETEEFAEYGADELPGFGESGRTEGMSRGRADVRTARPRAMVSVDASASARWIERRG